MASVAKAPKDIVDLMRRRNLTNIPKDQQRLLSSTTSWAVDLKNTPHGTGHVPGHVLQTVKEAHIRREAKRSSRSHSRPPSASSDGEAENRGQAPPHSSPSRHPREASSPERPISWPPSPARSVPGDDSPPKTQPPAALSIPAIETSSPLSSSAKTSSIAPPRPMTRLRAATSFEFDTSDAEDVDMESPKAQRENEVVMATVSSPPEVAAPINADAPSAQPQGDPARVANSSAAEALEVVQRPSRWVKPIVFSGVSTAPTDAGQMPSTATQEQETWDLTHSSSIIPSTYHEHSNAAPPSSALPQQQLTRNVPHPNDRDPYQAFITTYPDYVNSHAGDLWTFVRACVCLEIIEQERLLREYLYDDFIRAFAGGYIPYVRAAGAGQAPLPAIEWYNCLTGPILFNRIIVRRDNLGEILKTYPEETARAKVIIRKEPQAPDPPRAASPHLSSEPVQAQLVPPSSLPPVSASIPSSSRTSPIKSKYLHKLLSSTPREQVSRKRAAEKQLLREHFRKHRRLDAGVSSSCTS